MILEKPFCSTLAEAEELVRLAEEKGLYLFEAVTLFYQPNYALVRKALSSIGRIRLVISNYSQYSSRYDAYREKKVTPAFDPALSGGCLFDINIYNLNFVIGLFGVPKDIRYAANLGFNGIDTSGIAELRYEDFQAVCIGAKDSECRSSVIIQGENGSIYVPGPPSIVSAVELTVMGEKRNLQKNMYEHRMTAEFQAFADSFARGERAAMQQGMGSLLLTAGAKGKRFALPLARIMIHQPLGGAQGQSTDIQIQAKEILRLREVGNDILVKHTGQPREKVVADTERDNFMTGEITLRGRVLPIGGLKEKVLAAYREGMHTIILPKENQRDIDEIPEFVRDKLEFVPVESMDEVLEQALEK